MSRPTRPVWVNGIKKASIRLAADQLCVSPYLVRKALNEKGDGVELQRCWISYINGPVPDRYLGRLQRLSLAIKPDDQTVALRTKMEKLEASMRDLQAERSKLMQSVHDVDRRIADLESKIKQVKQKRGPYNSHTYGGTRIA